MINYPPDGMRAQMERGEVQVWWGDPSSMRAEHLRDKEGVLPEEERAAIARFVFAEDRRTALLTRLMVRHVLSRVCGSLSPDRWVFGRNAHGRPFIANPGFEWIEFNISHCRTLVVCALATRARLGVDVEPLERRAPVELAERYFAPSEAADVRRAPPALQPIRFLRYWTLKESYIKARGKGLSIPLESFAFRLSGVEPRAVLAEAADDDVTSWQFWLDELHATHVLALAYAPEDDVTLSLRLHPVETLLAG